MEKKRNSNIELLRIISMVFIVVSHYSVHNGIDNSSLSFGFNRFLLESLTLGNIGVILFVLITGYFMVEKKNSFNLKKLFTLYFQVLFYSVGIYILFLILGYESLSKDNLFENIFPFVHRKYWFVTVYIILYIFSPYINKFLNSLSRQEYFKFLLIMFLFVSFLPTFIKLDFYGNEVIQFLLFYSIGGYLKKYDDNIFSRNKNVNNISLIFVTLLLFLSVYLLDLLSLKGINFGVDSIYFFSRTSCLSIIFSILLFNLFAATKKFYSKKINLLSSCVFGIYLLSDNSLVRPRLWNGLLKNYLYVDSTYLIIHVVLSLILIFLFCWIIEFIRQKTVEKIFLLFFDKLVGIFKKTANVKCCK